MADHGKKEVSARHVAERIADRLFVNGFGEEAHRLVMVDGLGRDLGGWRRSAVEAAVVAAIEELGRG